jgi:hypothetical protein
MSDFFGGLTGGNIRFTDSRIDGDGPLPTSLSGPEGINGDPDGRYNFNDSLLSGITPYAYGQGRMGSDRNYQQVPNRKQFPVPPLWLPEPTWNTETTLEVSHSVDMGDIAFIVNAHHKQFMLSRGPFKHETQEQDHTLPQWNVFCNICTVNYLLAGMHNYAVHCAVHHNTQRNMEHAWYRLFRCFRISDQLLYMITEYQTDIVKGCSFANDMLALRCYLMLQQVVRLNIIPIGICSMSEKQGGQHEIGSKPVQAACNFFTTLTVDGQNRDLVNIWRAVEVDAGDFLILRLEFCKEEAHCKHVFVLNHYYKDTVTRTVTMHHHSKGRIQLVPDVFKLGISKHKDKAFVHKHHFQEKLGDISGSLADHLYEYATDPRYSGYWHIGQTYNKKQSFTNARVPINDMEMTKGQLLQINFAPVWKGTVHMLEDMTPENIDFCPAYALQRFMFGSVDLHTRAEDMLVDATVSDRQPVEITGPARFRANTTNLRMAANSMASNSMAPNSMASNPMASSSSVAATSLLPPAALLATSAPVAAAPVASQAATPAPAAPTPSANVATLPVVSNASVSVASAAQVSAAAVPAAAAPVAPTRSMAAVLDEAAEAANTSDTSNTSTAANRPKAVTSKSDWDFETEIENMFAAEPSTSKQKKTKTKSSAAL